MSGTKCKVLDVPITSTTPSVLCLKIENKPECEPNSCIRCGRCAEVCPRGLVPTKLANYKEKDKQKRFIKRKGEDCVACGTCNYVCPAKRKLKQTIASTESTSPYIHSKNTITRIMLWVIISLMPTTAFGIVKYGLNALIVVLASVVTAVLAELLFELIAKKKITVVDLSAIVTGLLFALNLPATVPWWLGALGASISIIVMKQLFGGLGRNIINPALGAKCLLMILFTEKLMVNNTNESSNLFDLFIGNVDGTIGGTSAIAVLIGAMILIIRGVVDIRISGVYVTVFAAFVAIINGQGFDVNYIVASLCDGSLMLAIWFMATDYATSPVTKVGKIVYGLILGVLSGVLTTYGQKEALSFVIILGNLIVPLIEWITLPRLRIKEETTNE